ncbi:superoxide dismutase [Mn] [Bordetella parapertussis Bpp5]|uniref:Superoxide dismutase n=2 Tax=Bordetella parapertussis TaxID=519 RepID=K0M8A4_BORPB|nr:superoxide dismutase [Mn] [Bordetella parapertussis Bpp5]
MVNGNDYHLSLPNANAGDRMPYVLPALSYAYDALEPHIDARTMEIHHTRHHQTYVNGLNAALEGAGLDSEEPVEQLLRRIPALPPVIHGAVRNHGGGHANHSLFWTVMSPSGGGRPDGRLAADIQAQLGGHDAFQAAFTQAALGRFGSGWAWLTVTPAGRLRVDSSANQDSPLMEGNTPILGLDVWEHAYYLQYQNRRPEYIEAFYRVVDWAEVARRYEIALAELGREAA